MRALISHHRGVSEGTSRRCDSSPGTSDKAPATTSRAAVPASPWRWKREALAFALCTWTWTLAFGCTLPHLPAHD